MSEISPGMIRISDVTDIGNGQRQCRVTISRGMQTESGYVAAGEHYPFVIDPTDLYGLNPLVCDMLAKGEMTRDEYVPSEPPPPVEPELTMSEPGDDAPLIMVEP